MISLKPGDKAPAFSSVDQDGKTVKLSDFLGQKVVLFFYPKDNTPTCTVEACNLRDNYAALQAKGYQVLGVSPDSSASHQKFIAKFDLPYRLLADTEKAILEAYGVWGKKIFMGKEVIGVLRTTFIIDEQGVIEEIIDKVKSKEHAEQILAHD
jgi:peroxiredoxin Q/BCP